MPYYIYRIKPFGQLELLEEHGAFAAASGQAKTLRAALLPNSPDKVKVIFAENALQAEDLLCQVREPGHPGEE
ncbi:hypothetical protein [Serpentinimonas maccroryi]|uniref:hypothetical protein n=1 Tax=Serpentinimonas maccroryi TaxID=1458426 RepID=UPI0020333538|nr:hypothetical protein [Serpentinimonas maccroryi]MCM2477931.1 hypothetical protein [Serpentinimonas maccroryi]